MKRRTLLIAAAVALALGTVGALRAGAEGQSFSIDVVVRAPVMVQIESASLNMHADSSKTPSHPANSIDVSLHEAAGTVERLPVQIEPVLWTGSTTPVAKSTSANVRMVTILIQ